MASRPPRRRPERALPRAARLRLQSEFESVYARGDKLVESRLVAFITRTDHAAGSRLGLSVSRRVGDSPTRNRVKRVLREAFRKLAPTLPEPVDLVLVARPGKAPTTEAEARDSLTRLVARWQRQRA